MSDTELLNASDRCDRCGAQAWLMVGFSVGELLFCAHHYRKHEHAIASSGGMVLIDNREQINLRPSVSASVH